jgi:ribosomal protein S18 acetylase RimI-like enzyme
MNIFRITANGWQIYRELRLEALRQDSEAFSGSYEESVQRSEDDWRKKASDPKSYIMIAQSSDEVIGMAAAYQEQGKKNQHVAHMWGAYIRKAHRGEGKGLELVKALLKELTLNKEIEKITLSFNTAQTAAVELYKELGFEIVGKLRRELKINGNYYDKYIMEKFL